MNRRRFLKYAGAGAVMAGSAVAGYEFGRWQTTIVPAQTRTVWGTTTQTVIQTLSRTTTETVRLASLNGRLFFDWNGNGKQDSREPAVAGALVRLKDSAGKVIAEGVTDSSGDYGLEDTRTGAYKLHVEVDKKFRYMCRSADEFAAVSEGYELVMDADKRTNIGLMEGYLTLPFAKGTHETKLRTYVDVDPSNGIRDWQGGVSTYNGHTGTDFCLPIGTKILAAAPGVVTRSWYAADDGNCIEMKLGDGKPTYYCHLKERIVSSGTKVQRGDIIGLSGQTGSLAGPNPHLHFQFGGGYGRSSIDPYRNLRDPLSLSYWTVDNKPQYPF